LGITANLSTVGVPELRVSNLVRVSGLWKQLTDNHVISNITRTIGSTGYYIKTNLGKEQENFWRIIRGSK